MTIIILTYISIFNEAIVSLIFIHIIIQHIKFSDINFDITSHIYGHILPLHKLLQFISFNMLKITNMAAMQTFGGSQCMITSTAYICTSGN